MQTSTSQKRKPEVKVFTLDKTDAFMSIFDSELVYKKYDQKTKKTYEYYNTPIAFDIETTSFRERRKKRACMYIWTFAVRSWIIQGRTWEEFQAFTTALTDRLHLNKSRRILIYVHNLGFEFQFMRKWLDWESVFAVDNRVPLTALTKTGLEFRCSWKLTNYSLATVAKNLETWDIAKLTGELDYKKYRHPGTPLSPQELAYTYNDVIIITCLIDEQMRQNGGNITRIPLTATGYTRRYCRSACLKKGKGRNWRYYNMIHGLDLTAEEYSMLREAFQGGFTHANAWYVDKVLHDIGSADLTSSYPAVMVRERFPMGPPESIEIESWEQFEYYLKLYCCCFEIELHELEPRTLTEHPLSVSKCRCTAGVLEDNGRVVRAYSLITTVTEQDYAILKEYYTWNEEETRIGRFLRFRKGYLPKELIESILELYRQKTELKGVQGKEAEYQHAKALLNAVYGMTVTNIVRSEYKYSNATGEWTIAEPDWEKQLEDYNKGEGRFLYYAWGVWVTAYARRKLFRMISKLGGDYVYSDTDSIYYRNPAAHRAEIEAENEENERKLKIACMRTGIDPEKISPKTIKGETKRLGDWTIDSEIWEKFKTLGAKRYMKEYNGKISLTVAGVNSDAAMKYLLKRYWHLHIFEHFTEFLEIPKTHSGKDAHYYLDDPTEGTVYDYRGEAYHYREQSGIFIEAASYKFSFALQFASYLAGQWLSYDIREMK